MNGYEHLNEAIKAFQAEQEKFEKNGDETFAKVSEAQANVLEFAAHILVSGRNTDDEQRLRLQDAVSKLMLVDENMHYELQLLPRKG